jgi:predicted nucleic acid-binding protein
MIVVDTNVIAYLYLSSAHTAAAERALLRDSDWVAPRLWRSELRNILALYVRQRLLGAADAISILERAEDLLAGGEHEVRSWAVLELSITSGCSAYDCEFVLLAQDLGIDFVTADQKLVTRFPSVAVALAGFAKQ